MLVGQPGNFQPLIDRDKNGTDDQERQGLTEIVLNEPDAAFVGLPRH